MREKINTPDYRACKALLPVRLLGRERQPALLSIARSYAGMISLKPSIALNSSMWRTGERLSGLLIASR